MYTLFDYLDRVAGEERRPFKSFAYLKEMCAAVEACVFRTLPEGKKNLIVAIPPRHYKTTVISQALPAWCLAEIAPDCEFILTSATAGLAVNNAMAVKRILSAVWHKKTYPHVVISKTDKDVQHYFKTTAGGAVYAAGLGGTITGFGAGKTRRGFGGAIIIDDPLKAEEASSQTMRDKAVAYYTNTLKSRRNSVHNTPFILVAQRLHPDDPIGWIMKNEPDDWHLVSFPALVDGKLLNPLTTSLAELETLKEVAPATFAAQYQQSPIIEGGNIIKLDWWRFYDPQEMKCFPGLIFLTADTAFKEEKHHDASVVAAWLGTRDHLYFLDSIYGRWNFPRLLQKAKDFWGFWKERGAREFWIEDKATGGPLEQMLNYDLDIPAQAWIPSKFGYPDNKVARMKQASFTVHGGRVLLPLGQEKVALDKDREASLTLPAKVLMEECAAFAVDMSHSHDDHCDAFTMADSLWKHAGGGQN